VSLNPLTGRMTPLAALDRDGAAVLAVDAATGRVVLQTAAGRIDVLDVRTGRRTRLASMPMVNRETAVVTDGTGGHIVVAQLVDDVSDIRVSVFAASSGRRLITFDVMGGAGSGYATFSLALDPRRGRLVIAPYIGPYDVFVYDWRSGTLLNTVTVPMAYGYPTAAIDPATGHAYVTTLPAPDHDQQYPSSPGYIVAFDPAKGSIVSSLAIGQTPQAILVDDAVGHVFTCSDGVAMVR